MKRKFVIPILLLIVLVIVGVILVIPWRVNGSFTEFEDANEVRSFLLLNLTIGESSLEEVSDFLDATISHSDDCGEPSTPSTLNTIPQADLAMACGFIREQTWVWEFTTYWYNAIFYFDDEILIEVEVDTDSTGF